MSKEANEPVPPAPPEFLPEPEKIARQDSVLRDTSKDARNPDWVAHHRLAAVAIPLWSLLVILIGILTILLFRSILFPR